jgi:hypothetical protein
VGGPPAGAPGRTTEAEWLAQVAASTAAVDHAADALAYVDAATGRLLGANQAMGALVGELPSRLQDLVEQGRVARPVADEVVSHVRDAGERCASWTTDCRWYPTTGDPTELDLSCSVVPRFGAPGRLLQLLASERGVSRPSPQPASGPDAPSTILELYDRDISIRRSDPRLREFWLEPRERLGVVTAVLVHPADQQAAWDVLDRVWRDQATTAEYSVRVVDALGSWAPISGLAFKLVGEDDDLVIATVRPNSRMKVDLPNDLLTGRESQLVDALFAGWRVPAIAARDRVAAKTVRNQLSGVYRKLGVAGQADLLLHYNPPVVGRGQRVDALLSPDWTEKP